MPAPKQTDDKEAQRRSIDRWIGYRWGLIVTRMGALAAHEYVGKYKLTTSVWRALAVIARYEPLSAATLCQHSRLDPPKASRAIEALVKRKLLSRRKDPTDERRAILTLTARGRAIFQDLEQAIDRLEDEITSTLTPAEKKALWSCAEKLDIALARISSEACLIKRQPTPLA